MSQMKYEMICLLGHVTIIVLDVKKMLAMPICQETQNAGSFYLWTITCYYKISMRAVIFHNQLQPTRTAI